MNISEINIFGGSSSEESPQVNNDESSEVQEEEFDCPVLGLMENMYFEPRPYGSILSMGNTEKVLKEIGYRIVSKDGKKYALGPGEKLARSKEKKAEQTVFEVYRRLAEELAAAKFVKDWKDVHGTAGDSGKA